MRQKNYIFELIPIDLIEMDPAQPRQDYGTDGEQNRLYISIKQLGSFQPLIVRKTPQGKFRILDGHRRYICLKRLVEEDKLIEFEKIPCRVYEQLPTDEEERIRFEVQNNRRSWKPIERAQVINRIRESGSFRSQEDVAKFLNIPRTLVGNSLQLRSLNLDLIAKMEKRDLKPTYQTELVRLIPKLCKIKNIEAEMIIQNIISRIDQKVIRSAKELRTLRRVFQYAKANEDFLYEYLNNSTMTVDQLIQKSNIIRTNLTFVAQKTIQVLKEKKNKGSKFLEEEKTALKELLELLSREFQSPTSPPDHRAFFVVASGNKKTDQHYERTIHTKWTTHEIRNFLLPTELQNIKTSSQDHSFMMWGHLPANKNISAWQSMQAGDTVLIYRKGKIVLAAKVLYKIQSKSLAKYLWGENDQGQTYEYLYFFANESLLDFPQSQINHLFGYSQNYTPQGLVKINQAIVDKMLTNPPTSFSVLKAGQKK
ncbi:MAG: ParB/RepB/Spo0J family partition protein [Candidatus Kerfeldbacteria bacterium]|nr:ParB/RepB/Spo0J family partition protein [Candidatus Kerfeldbacteria bacterium]